MSDFKQRDGVSSSTLLTRKNWEMGIGERAAIAGMLAELRPAVSIELGTFRGGSLATLAAYSGHVHTFDLTLQIEAADFPNVTFHVGDSHKLLPEVLAQLAADDTHVGFALIDGDHSPEGVKQDLRDLLDSPALRIGVVLLHDTANEAVRRGIESVRFQEYPRVAMVDLDFVPRNAVENRLAVRWGGLGLVLLDSSRTGPGATPAERRKERDRYMFVRDLRRRARRMAGIGLRRAGLHPAQLKARRNDRS